MAFDPDHTAKAVEDFIAGHATPSRPIELVEHGARPAQFAAVEAYRALGRHIAAMGDLVLRDPWDDAGLAAMDREVCRLASEVEPALERMRLLRECHGARH